MRASMPGFNALSLRLAGRRFFPIYAIVHHRGRRSGRPFATPVAVRPTPDGLAIALTWGSRADWCQNVLAAGGCLVRWKGADIALTDPRIVDARVGFAAFAPFQRAVLQRANVTAVLVLRRA